MIVRVLLFLIGALAAAADRPDVFREVQQIAAGLSEITGWRLARPVPAQILEKEKFRRYVEDRVNKVVKPEEVRAEELVLKMLGLAPVDFDLKQSTVDLVSEQAAAFYDYNRKRLYILDSTPEGDERRMALIHELAHALADQNHRLKRYVHGGSDSDEGSTARQAVIEGQASWLTFAYLSKLAGRAAEVPARLIEMETESSSQYPVFSNAPLYLRESLVFPYTQGLRFQDALWRKLGQDAFNQVFRKPPCSTQQILHPDFYWSGTCPPQIDPPKFPLKGYKQLIEGTVGELEHQILIRQYIGAKESREQSSEWRAGFVRIFESKRDRRPGMVYVSQWASEQAARTYFRTYRRILAGKWKKLEFSVQSDDELRGEGDTGGFSVTRAGVKVVSLEGLR